MERSSMTNVIAQVLHVAQRAKEQFNAHTEHMTPTQFTLLSAVATTPDQNQNQLAAITRIDRSTLATMATRLTDKSWLHRERPRSDARQNTVRLTPEGRAALANALPTTLDAEAAFLAPLTLPQRAEFIKLLQKLTAPAAA
jgi:MarR family transcriptional regulator, temperature-dependent positive regulator of motility